MRIGINALYMLPGRVGGSEIYLRNLVSRLPRVCEKNQYFLFVNRETRGAFPDLHPAVSVVECDVPAASRARRVFYEQFILPFRVRSLKIDSLLSAGMTAPFIVPFPAKSVVVIYDLQHVNQPQNFPAHYLLFLKCIIYLSARRAQSVIAISNHVKNDLTRLYNINAQKITVSRLAADRDEFFPRNKGECAFVRERYNLPEDYILYPASTLPHKNHIRLLNAFAKVRGSVQGIKLLLIGARDKGSGGIDKAIQTLGLERDVVFLGWLKSEDIPFVYSASRMLVFPSLHEGFGLPIIEAMSAGVPVACSAIEPLKEVAGDSAVFFDPYDDASIAGAIIKVLNDFSLREGLREKGLKRAELFSWDQTARDTLKAIETSIRGL